MRTAATAADGAATASGAGLLVYEHIMLALADPSPYFGDGSKQVWQIITVWLIILQLRCQEMQLRCQDI